MAVLPELRHRVDEPSGSPSCQERATYLGGSKVKSAIIAAIIAAVVSVRCGDGDRDRAYHRRADQERLGRTR